MIYPADIEEAAENWGANCGPCSLNLDRLATWDYWKRTARFHGLYVGSNVAIQFGTPHTLCQKAEKRFYGL